MENQHSHNIDHDHNCRPQVKFTSVQKTHCLTQDLLVQFEYIGSDGNSDIVGDRIGLYKMPRTEPYQHVAYAWIDSWDGVVTLSHSVLPMEEGEYMLQYIQENFTVVGTSQTFTMVKEFVAPELVSSQKNVNDVELGPLVEELETVSIKDMVNGNLQSCEELQQQIACLSLSEKLLSNFLEKTLEKNEELVKTFERKDSVVKKLRGAIEQEDALQHEVEQLKEEHFKVKAELYEVKQESEEMKSKIRMNEEKVNDILVSLDVHKRFLDESKNYAKDLEEDKRELTDMNMELNEELKKYKIMHNSMKESITMLENDKLDLELQLKNVLRESHSRISQESALVSSLQEEIIVLMKQLAEMRSDLAKYYELLLEKSEDEFVVVDLNPNDQKVSKNEEIAANGALEQIVSEVGDAFHNVPQAPSIPLTVSSSSTEVPPSSSSIQQPTCTSPSGPPETHPSAEDKELTGALTSTDPRLECPFCSETFLQNQSNDLEIHVERHDIENMLDCPVCNKLFDKIARLEYQNHVEAHFPEVYILQLYNGRGGTVGSDVTLRENWSVFIRCRTMPLGAALAL